MFRPVESYTATRAMTLNGTAYSAGETIAWDDIVHSRKSDALLSRKFIIPIPDPHARRTKPETPTPVSTPAKFRKTPPGPVIPTSVVVTPNPGTVQGMGGTLQMYAQVLPSGAPQEVTWASSVEPQATVDQNGLVTSSVNQGATSISARPVSDQSIYGSASVSIVPPPPPALTAVAANPASHPALQAYAGSDIITTPPKEEAGDAYYSCTATSSDTSIATINWPNYNRINITGKALGSCTVTVASKADPSIKCDIPVTVTLV